MQNEIILLPLSAPVCHVDVLLVKSLLLEFQL